MEQGSARAVTSEGLIQVLLAKDNIKIMHSTRVELHTENHITGRAAKLLVVALQLQRGKGMGHQDKPPNPWLLPKPGAELRILTKISPLSSKPGSMVMQMPVWLSPCTLLQRGMVGGCELRCRAPKELLAPPQPALPPKTSQG